MDLIRDINDATREKDEVEAAIAVADAAAAEAAEAAGKTIQDYLTDIQAKDNK